MSKEPTVDLFPSGLFDFVVVDFPGALRRFSRLAAEPRFKIWSHQPVNSVDTYYKWYCEFEWGRLRLWILKYIGFSKLLIALNYIFFVHGFDRVYTFDTHWYIHVLFRILQTATQSVRTYIEQLYYYRTEPHHKEQIRHWMLLRVL